MSTHAPYVGRFAPSPSGPLHLGSLVTALASWLDARHHQGIWYLRMEDLDRARVSQAHADDILRTLEHYGLFWDGTILYQSARDEAYAVAISHLREQGLLYACTCSRRELVDSQAGLEGPIYPGTCRLNPPHLAARHALRVKVGARPYSLIDRIQGECLQTLSRDIGDFILRRSDGLYAYQLAVVVDDASQGITHVVRGADLLSSSPRQIFLQRMLAYPCPVYAHVPLLTTSAGTKLSKREAADPVGRQQPEAVLLTCLRLLGQDPPADLVDQGRDAILGWSQQNWDISKVPRSMQIPLSSMA